MAIVPQEDLPFTLEKKKPSIVPMEDLPTDLEAPKRSYKASEVPVEAVKSFLPSLGTAAGNIYEAVTDPVGSFEQLMQATSGGIIKMLPEKQQRETIQRFQKFAENSKAKSKEYLDLAEKAQNAGNYDLSQKYEKFAADEFKNAIDYGKKYETINATATGVSDFYSDRYGGWENVKRTFAEDPAGALLDFSAILRGGVPLTKIKVKGKGLPESVPRTLEKAADIVDVPTIGVTRKAIEKGVPMLGAGIANLTEMLGGPSAQAVKEGALSGFRDIQKKPTVTTQQIAEAADTTKAPASVKDIVSGLKESGKNFTSNLADEWKRLTDPAVTSEMKLRIANRLDDRPFLKNIRDKEDFDAVVVELKSAIETIREHRNKVYQTEMKKIKTKTDKNILSFDDVNNALEKVQKFAFRKDNKTGKLIVKNEKASKAYQDIVKKVDEWKQANPADFHTASGFDDLKQTIGGIIDSAGFEERQARALGQSVYNSIKKTITKQAPTYSKVMQNYSKLTDELREFEKAFSTGKKASTDAALRKLQSVMRDTVNTNFGNRRKLLKQIQEQGDIDIMPALAGQSLRSILPSGVRYGVNPLLGYGAYQVGGIPLLAGQAAISSPRLVGETAYKAGQAAKVGKTLFDSPELRKLYPYLSQQGLLQE